MEQRSGGESFKIKNRNPAPIQISAEQILREAKERQFGAEKPPKQQITDHEELEEYRLRKRKHFEDSLRLSRHNFGTWIRYAQFEESQKEYERARSIFERALNLEHRNQSVWMRYAEFEMRTRNINHARNVWDRAVTLLPRVDQFWYKYAYMEEMLGNVSNARQIYERWMQWQPQEQAWYLYLKLEKRYKERDRQRAIYARFVAIHPQAKHWLKWAKFEEDIQQIDNARNVYTQAIDTLGEDHGSAELFITFAKFETRLKEFERARAIYNFGLKQYPDSMELQDALALFEKQFGSRRDIENALIVKRRKEYQQQVASNPKNYDLWFDWLKMEETQCSENTTAAAIDHCRDVYEQAIAQVPPLAEKKYWRRYIYLWINYALFEELIAEDIAKTRQVYQECLNIIPHKQFTFAKIWLLYAKFEIRQLDVQTARKTLGRSLGMCPKPKLFKGYIELELQMREFDRCRKLYEKFIEFEPNTALPYLQFAELESLLDEYERTRAIYNLALGFPLDMPELVWKAYLDFEQDLGNWKRVRTLYRKLLTETQHPRVWLSYALFELTSPQDEDAEDQNMRVEERPKIPSEQGMVRARAVLEEGYGILKKKLESKEERRLLLELWIEFEEQHYSPDYAGSLPNIIDDLRSKLPQPVKKRRTVQTEDGGEEIEEYIDYIFPEDEAEDKQKGVNKLLAMARMWKQNQEVAEKRKADEVAEDETEQNEEDFE